MDLTNSVKCVTCKVIMHETIYADIPTRRLSHYYCEVCGKAVYLTTNAPPDKSTWEIMSQEIHPLEDK